MIKKMMCLALAMMPLPLAANVNWECSVICEYYSSDIDQKDPDFVEEIIADMHGSPLELGRYRVTLLSRSEDVNLAYSVLRTKCFDTAAAYSTDLFLDTDYAPEILDARSSRAPESAKVVCKKMAP